MASSPPAIPAPPPSHLQRDSILKNILKYIEQFRSQFQEIDFDSLEHDVLEKVLDGDFDPEVQIRGFLRAWKDTPAFSTAFEAIDNSKLRSQITAFIEGTSAKEVVGDQSFNVRAHPSPGAKHHFSLLEELKKLVLGGLHLKGAIEEIFQASGKHEHAKKLPVLYENDVKTKVMEVYSNVPFQNWGQTVNNTPKYTFLPTTVHGCQEIVKFAIENNLRVRCAGYRHSWSSTFSQDGEVFVSFVNLHEVNTLPDPMSLLPGDYTGQGVPDLKTIELKEATSPGKRLCRIGTAVTNEDFRRWAVKNNAWALPVDVILVEVTVGGVNGPICHGAGRRHKTISDYVRRVEYIDCHGKLQLVDDPGQIKAAAGAFGLLGIITHLTFELDAMTYAVMEPRKVDVGLAIPPIKKEDIPVALRSDWYNAPDADKQLAAAHEDFSKRAENDYYSEWFWFTYQQRVWVNTWNTDASNVGVTTYPSDAQTFIQWVEGWLGQIITSSKFFNALPGYWQAQLLATMGMAALPPTRGEDATKAYKTALPNALHFRRGVQNMRVRDIEFQIPLPPRSDDPSRPDFAIVQRSWWDIINLVYTDAENKTDPSSPMRLTLEMRIMAGSDVIMAPQRGNSLGTCSIEVLSVPDAVEDDEWQDFIQRVADIWMGYEGLNVRPHWAKEWESLTFKGMEARKYLKEVAYRDAIPEFRQLLKEIGEGHGWNLNELQGRFSNELWDKMVFE